MHLNYLVIHFQRLPNYLLDTKCVCQYAPMIEGDARSDREFECQEIRVEVRVLRFRDDCGEFQASSESISVGCFALWPASEAAETRKDDGERTLIPNKRQLSTDARLLHLYWKLEEEIRDKVESTYPKE